MNTPRQRHFEHPSPQQGDEVWQLAIGLELPEGVHFLRDARGARLLEIDESVPYPRTPHFASQELGGLALKTTHNGYLELPDNSSTLVTILNEAAGATDSFEVTPSQSKTVETLAGLFGSLTESLARLRNRGHVLPKTLDYRQVLVDKDQNACKLLPPLELVPIDASDVESTHIAWAGLYQGLITSMKQGALTTSQRNLVKAINPVVKSRFTGKA